MSIYRQFYETHKSILKLGACVWSYPHSLSYQLIDDKSIAAYKYVCMHNYIINIGKVIPDPPTCLLCFVTIKIIILKQYNYTAILKQLAG